MKEGAVYRRVSRGMFAVTGLCAVVLVAGCVSKPEPKALVIPKAKPKEYFSEADYGVKASPKVTNKRTRLKRGGGRYLVGKPYQVKGKWYYPQEMTSYHKTGTASWYGSAFHGRLTANGEVYDMTALTAAHPTMPLPSYARVTNTANGSSVIVRVNDRGPYHGGRIMDLSARAAELLDYTHSGTAKIDVQYLGPAPVEGNDDEYLMASYRPSKNFDAPSVGLPQGVMLASASPAPVEPVALAGTTPSGTPAQAFPGVLTSGAPLPPAPAGIVTLPEFGPEIPDRPPYRIAALVSPERLGYAAEPRSGSAFAVLGAEGLSPSALVSRFGGGGSAADNYVAVGTFDSEEDARAIAASLKAVASTSVEILRHDGRSYVALTATPAAGRSVDDVVEASWVAGATDAFVVRD